MRLQTDHLPPELSIYKNMSVLEKGIDTDLPVFASNIDGIDLRYQTFTAAGKSPAKLAALPGPRVRDVYDGNTDGNAKAYCLLSRGYSQGLFRPAHPFIRKAGPQDRSRSRRRTGFLRR